MKALISGVPGFVTYAAVRSGDGGVTVTVCEDKAGTDESSRRQRSGSRRTSARRPIRPRSPRGTRSCSSTPREEPRARASKPTGARTRAPPEPSFIRADVRRPERQVPAAYVSTVRSTRRALPDRIASTSPGVELGQRLAEQRQVRDLLQPARGRLDEAVEVRADADVGHRAGGRGGSRRCGGAGPRRSPPAPRVLVADPVVELVLGEDQADHAAARGDLADRLLGQVVGLAAEAERRVRCDDRERLGVGAALPVELRRAARTSRPARPARMWLTSTRMRSRYIARTAASPRSVRPAPAGWGKIVL